MGTSLLITAVLVFDFTAFTSLIAFSGMPPFFGSFRVTFDSLLPGFLSNDMFDRVVSPAFFRIPLGWERVDIKQMNKGEKLNIY